MNELEIQLATIIDNIDTASDIAKSDDTVYRNLVANEIVKFRKLVSSDGYVFKAINDNK